MSSTTKSRDQTDSSVSSEQTLSQFLASNKERYLRDISQHTAQEWTVVVGNESGDLDTVASSIAYSWIQREMHSSPIIALIQIQRADLTLRPENLHALSLAGLQDDFRELLCVSDIPNCKQFPSNKFVLVDHNRILPQFTVDNPSHVVAVVDHHEDEGLYKDSANPRTISDVGSCASLIAHLHPTLKLPVELATLLLCAILIDSNGLKVGGKATQTDREAAAILLPQSILAHHLPPNFLSSSLEQPIPSLLHEIPSIRQLAEDLSTKKETLPELGTLDLLRRDFKQYMFTLPSAVVMKAGLSTVPRSLIACENLSVWSRRWMACKGLSVFGVLTTFRAQPDAYKKGRGKHCREMLWLVRGHKDVPDSEAMELRVVADMEGDWVEPEGLDVDELASKLWAGLEESEVLKLKTHETFVIDHNIRARAYKQGNTDATRKVIAPLLKSILEGPTLF